MEAFLAKYGMIVFLVVISAVMYLLMIRPRQKQQKVHEAMMKELRPGDRVIMAGGLYGQIESIGEDTAILKIESGPYSWCDYAALPTRLPGLAVWLALTQSFSASCYAALALTEPAGGG